MPPTDNGKRKLLYQNIGDWNYFWKIHTVSSGSYDDGVVVVICNRHGGYGRRHIATNTRIYFEATVQH